MFTQRKEFPPVKLDKYSFGIGDRFGRQAQAQLQAIIEAQKLGANITPVWNKSHREHSIIHTTPPDVRREADAAVAALNWTGPYFVDADHIDLNNVDSFMDASDFFTLDVAEFIGKEVPLEQITDFINQYEKHLGTLKIPALNESLDITRPQLEAIARKYLPAIARAGSIYRHIAQAKGTGNFITEVSMDETDQPQTPVEMLFILAMISDQGIPAQTVAPKFTGRFNKGVDYVGNVDQFAREFEQDLAVIQLAVEKFDLPENLKLSVHSGSDKFSIYRPIRSALTRFDAGLHLKTAGTTWLEELIGLAGAGPDGRQLVCQVYTHALERFDELCGPYAAVIDIDRAALPTPHQFDAYDGPTLARTIRHDPTAEQYNPHVRQLLHVGYKIAAEMGATYLDALTKHRTAITECVRDNLLDRHIKPLFLGH